MSKNTDTTWGDFSESNLPIGQNEEIEDVFIAVFQNNDDKGRKSPSFFKLYKEEGALIRAIADKTSSMQVKKIFRLDELGLVFEMDVQFKDGGLTLVRKNSK